MSQPSIGTSSSFEYEARISTFIFEDTISELGKNPKIHFHPNGSYLRPYVNICYITEVDNTQINIGWPINSIWVGPGRNQEKAFEGVVKRLEFGVVKTFPIPFDIFIGRLEDYICDILGKAVKDSKHIDNTDVRSLGNAIACTLLEDDKRYEYVSGTEFYHRCIDYDRYVTSKEALRNARPRIINELSVIIGNRDDAEKWLIEYERTNYFSWYGIRIRTSPRTFSFI